MGKPAATQTAAPRTAAPSEGFVYCAYRAPQLCIAPAIRNAATSHAATTRAAAPPEDSAHWACHTKGSRGLSGATRATASRRHCIVRLPHENQPQLLKRLSAVRRDAGYYMICF